MTKFADGSLSAALLKVDLMIDEDQSRMQQEGAALNQMVAVMEPLTRGGRARLILWLLLSQVGENAADQLGELIERASKP